MKKILFSALLVCFAQLNAQICFSPATNFAAGSVPYGICKGDFNGDGKVDLAVANYSSNNITVSLGDGIGNFPLFKAKNSHCKFTRMWQNTCGRVMQRHTKMSRHAHQLAAHYSVISSCRAAHGKRTRQSKT